MFHSLISMLLLCGMFIFAQASLLVEEDGSTAKDMVSSATASVSNSTEECMSAAPVGCCPMHAIDKDALYGTDVEERIVLLQKRIMEQQRILQDLEQQLDTKWSQSYTRDLVDRYILEGMAEESVGITAGYEKGFFIRSGDGNFHLRVNGIFRTQAGLYEANSVTNNNVRIAEARVDFHMYLFKNWHIRVRPDFSVTDGAILRGSFIEYLGMDCLKIRIGICQTPFSLEIESDPDILTIVRSPFTINQPGHEVGLSIYGNGIPFTKSEFLSDHFSYWLGIYNGEDVNHMDANDDKMFMIHTRFYPLGMKENNVFFQMGAYINDRDMDDGARLNLQGLRNHEVFGDLGGKVANVDKINGHRMAFSSAIKYQKDNIRLETDFIYVEYDRDSYSDIRTWGFSAGFGYFIPVGQKDANMGIEPLCKMSYTDVDDTNGDGSGDGVFGTLSDVTGQEIWEFVLGARFHASKFVRLDLNWIMYDLDQTNGTNNTDDRRGGGIIHAFLFQSIVKW